MSKLFQYLWLQSNRKHHKHFLRDNHNIADVQKEKLLSYLHLNKDTEIGRTYDFSAIESIPTYQANIPIIEEYEQLHPHIQKIASGHDKVLTNDKVLFFESTSGSSGLSKLIPYNRRLKLEFEKYAGIWMNELYLSNPKAFHGKSYWSLSPPLKNKSTSQSGIKIGTSSDTDYFSPISKWFLKNILAVNHHEVESDTPHEFYLNTARQLLATKDLSFISIWSPSFIIQLDNFIRSYLKEIVQHPCITPERQKELLAQEFQWHRCFPFLTVLSCWTDAQAAIWLPQLEQLFKSVSIQGKGLLSTEGVISIPTRAGNALAYTCQFYEFRNTETNEISLANQLEIKKQYEVILTTGGGLYRYNTRDIVEVITIKDHLPILKFIGRSSSVSDLVGEKLDPNTLVKLLQDMQEKFDINALLFQPNKSHDKLNYKALVFGTTSLINECQLLEYIDRYLHHNPYYAQAIKLGQLSALELELKPPTVLKKISRTYANQYQIKDGDLKLPLILPLEFDWSDITSSVK